MIKRTLGLSAVLTAIFSLGVFTACSMPPENPRDEDIERRDMERRGDLFIPSTDNPRIRQFRTNVPGSGGPYGRSYWMPLAGSLQSPFVSWRVKVTKVHGRASAGFGIVMCYGDHGAREPSMLTVMIRTDGYFQVGEVIGSRYRRFEGWKKSDAIFESPGSTNTLAVVREGEMFVLSINAVEVYRFHDNTEAPVHLGGEQGYVVVTAPNENLGSRFVDVIFEELG